VASDGAPPGACWSSEAAAADPVRGSRLHAKAIVIDSSKFERPFGHFDATPHREQSTAPCGGSGPAAPEARVLKGYRVAGQGVAIPSRRYRLPFEPLLSVPRKRLRPDRRFRGSSGSSARIVSGQCGWAVALTSPLS
jgi:hypothetical protein